MIVRHFLQWVRTAEVAERAAKATIWVAERDGQVVGSVTLAVAAPPELRAVSV